MKEENKCTALIKHEPDHVDGEIVEESLVVREEDELVGKVRGGEAWAAYFFKQMLPEEKRWELEEALRAGRVKDPFSIGTLISIGISLASSAASSPLARALMPKKGERC